MSEEITDVVFRKFRDGDVIALFPRIEEPDGMVSSYMHVGQHAGASYEGMMRATVSAIEDEYKDLKRELESCPYGYNLRVVKRRQRSKR